MMNNDFEVVKLLNNFLNKVFSVKTIPFGLLQNLKEKIDLLQLWLHHTPLY